MKPMTAVDDTALNEVFHGHEDGFHGITDDSSKEKNVISVFFLRKWKVLFSGDISVSVSHTFYSELF